MALTRVVNGIHVSNSRHWDVEQMLRAARTNGAVTILHHMMFPRDELVDQYGDVENAYWYGKLRWGWPAQGIPPAPERFIHVRLFQPNWRDYEPRAVAQQAVKLLSNWRFEGLSADLWQDPFVGVSPCNDQNLARRPMILTTNKRLASWGEVLHDPDRAAARPRRAFSADPSHRPGAHIRTGQTSRTRPARVYGTHRGRADSPAARLYDQELP